MHSTHRHGPTPRRPSPLTSQGTDTGKGRSLQPGTCAREAWERRCQRGVPDPGPPAGVWRDWLLLRLLSPPPPILSLLNQRQSLGGGDLEKDASPTLSITWAITGRWGGPAREGSHSGEPRRERPGHWPPALGASTGSAGERLVLQEKQEHLQPRLNHKALYDASLAQASATPSRKQGRSSAPPTTAQATFCKSHTSRAAERRSVETAPRIRARSPQAQGPQPPPGSPGMTCHSCDHIASRASPRTN